MRSCSHLRRPKTQWSGRGRAGASARRQNQASWRIVSVSEACEAYEMEHLAALVRCKQLWSLGVAMTLGGALACTFPMEHRHTPIQTTFKVHHTTLTILLQPQRLNDIRPIPKRVYSASPCDSISSGMAQRYTTSTSMKGTTDICVCQSGAVIALQ